MTGDPYWSSAQAALGEQGPVVAAECISPCRRRAVSTRRSYRLPVHAHVPARKQTSSSW
jgi:hypothetical protein